MLRIALTGGLCSGKSTVSAMFAELGVPTINADQIGHHLLRAGSPWVSRVVDEFGAGVLASDGSIDRKKLAALVFAGTPESERRRRRLNALLHPPIMEEVDRRISELHGKTRHPFVIIEAALFVEEKLHHRFDRLAVVTCNPEQQVLRFQGRTGGSREEAESRLKVQLPEEAKARLADYVINNSGNLEDTRHQVENLNAMLHAETTSEAAG